MADGRGPGAMGGGCEDMVPTAILTYERGAMRVS